MICENQQIMPFFFAWICTIEMIIPHQAQTNTIALHLDNDFAGRNASQTIADQRQSDFDVSVAEDMI
jgi:hypothetical protein